MKIKDRGPYPNNEEITVQEELQWGKDTITPGAIIKFKAIQGKFTFRQLAYNEKLNKTWVDCYEIRTRQFRSFYLDQLKGVVKQPKRRRKH